MEGATPIIRIGIATNIQIIFYQES